MFPIMSKTYITLFMLSKNIRYTFRLLFQYSSLVCVSYCGNAIRNIKIWPLLEFSRKKMLTNPREANIHTCNKRFIEKGWVTQYIHPLIWIYIIPAFNIFNNIRRTWSFQNKNTKTYDNIQIIFGINCALISLGGQCNIRYIWQHWVILPQINYFMCIATLIQLWNLKVDYIYCINECDSACWMHFNFCVYLLWNVT